MISLKILKEEIMEIDVVNNAFNTYDEIFSLLFKHDLIEMRYDMELILADNLSSLLESKFIRLRFFNVSELYISKLNGLYNQFHQMRIINNDDGLENVNYELIQIEDDDICFKFKDFSYEFINYVE